MSKRFLYAAVLFALPSVPAVAGNGTITIEPFIAYYATGEVQITGPNVDTPIKVPHRLGHISTDVEPGLQKLCGAGAKFYYNSIGQSGGGSNGVNVFAGVCVKQSQ